MLRPKKPPRSGTTGEAERAGSGSAGRTRFPCVMLNRAGRSLRTHRPRAPVCEAQYTFGVPRFRSEEGNMLWFKDYASAPNILNINITNFIIAYALSANIRYAPTF